MIGCIPHVTPPAPCMVAIYALVDPRDGQTRYVGKSKSPWARYQIHCHHKHKAHTHCGIWLRALRRLGLKPDLRIIDWVEPDRWEQAERHYIALARRAGCALTNIQRGGAGSNVHQTYKRPDMVERNKARVWTPEMRARAAAARARQPYTAQTREKLSAARTGRKHSSLARARMAEGYRARASTKEQRAGNAKLRADEVQQIRCRAAAGEPRRALAVAYGVSCGTIDLLLARGSWAWVEDGMPPLPPTVPAGERNPASKLTADEVREIRRLYREKQANQVQLAARFGIDQTSVSRIILRKSWSHLAD